MAPRALFMLVLACAAGCAGTERIYVVNGGGETAGADPTTSECGPGAMKVLGDDACTPIGWTDCGEGFAKDPSGWGCHEVMADGCTGATRAALGSATCVPIGDCSAPFPPAGATLFVSANGPTSATHFRSLESAALASRSGDVIAVDAGIYRESAQLDRPVTIVGRCAEQVIFDGTGLGTPGLIVDVATKVRGVTLRRFPTGIQTVADLDLSDSILEDNDDAAVYAETEGSGAIVARVSRTVIRNTKPRTIPTAFGIDLAKGTTMDIVDTEIVGSQGAGIIVAPTSKANVVTSIIRDSSADSQGQGGIGIHGEGGDATIRDSVFVGNADSGIRSAKGATITVERTVVRSTNVGHHGVGHGLAIASGATLTASKVVITDTSGIGVTCEGSTTTVTDSVVRAQHPAPDGDFGDGVYVFNGGSLALTRVAILDNARAGADAFDAKTELSFDHVLLSGTKSLPAGDMGLGVAIGFGAHAKISSSLVGSNHHTGIYAFDNGTLDLTKTAVRDTTQELAREPLGHGILVTDSKHVVIDECEVVRSAGIGVAFASTSATISKSRIADNAVGIHVQDGSTLVQVDAAPAQPAGSNVSVTADTVFEGNATRVGSGTVPLPDPLPAPKL